MSYQPIPLPAHLPDKLTITLWDFSWYVRTGPGEPFADLDAAFAEAVERGYNTVRICAMPYLLFGSGLDTSAVRLGPLGNGYGRRVRWYDVEQPTTIDARAQLLDLFRAAARHDCFVILSSWEYQQSSSFAADPAWCDALMAIDPERRAEAQALALADLVDFLDEQGLADRIAFTEIHNEVQIGHLADGLPADPDERVVALRPRLERGLGAFHDRHPDRPVTVNYARVPVGAMRGIPETIDVLVTHPYVYGVLGAFIAEYGLRGPASEFDQDRADREILLPGAPRIGDWAPDAGWRLTATIVAEPEIYVHDWGDAEAIDRWLYRHYPAWEQEMITTLRLWLAVARDWAAAHRVPVVFGEGWIGYTPRDGRFEEGPVGAEFCRLAVDESTRIGARGTIVCSNAAPQHAMWADIALQRACNQAFATGSLLAEAALRQAQGASA
ncbi:cellulase-like family protein [Microlunatus ginsengisoli]|uniref:Sugar-binding cellulase-like n=1 Tax=Microlunatus ginsengisoli TaxID=363863 RepID=A0ABP6ZYH1_9ACTN